MFCEAKLVAAPALAKHFYLALLVYKRKEPPAKNFRRKLKVSRETSSQDFKI